MFMVDELLQQQFPQLNRRPWLFQPLKFLVSKLLHEREFQEFAHNYPHLTGIDFVEQVLLYFNFSYSLRGCERERIPADGRVVIIANHPIGSLDGLALIKLISELRPDVKVVSNQMLMALKPLHPLLLPVNNMSGGTVRAKLKRIHQHLCDEGALIIFPAGEVSRLRPQGVRDPRWHDGFLKIAARAQAPILPVHLEGRNSSLFYSASMIYKPLSTALLVTEMFKQRSHDLPVRIGEIIPFDSWQSLPLASEQIVKLFKRHLYRLGRDGKPVFRTQPAVALPESRADLARVLFAEGRQLGETDDGKLIWLYDYRADSPVMREIGRLREIAFRAVGEGTQSRRDIDIYDCAYQHLILWDTRALEIVGAYRLGDAARLHRQTPGLYSASLFDYLPTMDPYFEQGLELGRGFVQPRYWGKRSLDYLWYGIGAFLRCYPQYRYLFGPVSLSGQLPVAARDLLVDFYGRHFRSREMLAIAHHPYVVSDNTCFTPAAQHASQSYPDAFRVLKARLAGMGVAVPTLYKHYTELCAPGGARFLAFGVDEHFGNCIDGLILIDTQMMAARKKERYFVRPCHGPESQLVK